MAASVLFQLLFFFFFIIQINCASLDDFCDSACGLVALIPARGGSKGLKNKNLAILGGKTLLARSIQNINSSKEFREIWVSTDAENIAREAENEGAKVHWRNPETATDNATTLSVVQDFLAYHPGVVSPANFNPMKRPRRQDWSGELYETGMFYIAKRHLIESGALQNDKCQIVEVPSIRSLEIDVSFDLEFARALLPLLHPC